MSLLADNYRVVLDTGDDDDDDFEEEETVDEHVAPAKATKKAKKAKHDDDDEEDDDDNVIICPVCGEEVVTPVEELVEGARIVCDSGDGCMAELEVVSFDKEHHPRLKVVEDEK